AAWCWGRNDYGQLGDGSSDVRETPVAVAGGLSFTQLTTGREHTCGLTVGAAIYCWGSNGLGQLARDSIPLQLAPVRVGVNQRFDTVVTSAFHTCALSLGTAWCWGADAYGQLGRGTSEGSSTAVVPV